MELRELVSTSDAVAATPSRSAKVALLVDLLRRLEPDEVHPAVAMLAGTPRQGRIGVGWRTLQALRVEAADEPGVAVAELDSTLQRLASTAGAGSATERSKLLSGLLARCTADEQRFVRCLLTGELRQGALEGVMADAVAAAAAVPAPAVRRAAMLSGDLPAAAATALTQGEAGLAGVTLRVGRPVLPMLAASSDDVASALSELGTSSVEWKLDGVRVQVHRRDGDVALFSRNLNDVTARMPMVADAMRALPARSFVLDGEAIGLDDEERPGAFADTMSGFGRRRTPAETTLSVRFFDVLHADGRDLLDRPLSDRLEVLDSLVGRLAVPRVLTDDPGEAERFAASALAAGHEGVMVKAAGSPYEAGRRGRAWRKVKPVRTLDLVVIGVEWGSGRRQGWLSNLHLAARHPDSGELLMVGKTFKGLTDELLAWQTEQLLALRVAEHGHVVEVRPELVVEIALDGVQASTRYPGGVALRFARVRRYRPDKSPADADTIDAVRALGAGILPTD